MKYKRKQAERNKNTVGDKEKAARTVRENSELTVSSRNRRRDEKWRREGQNTSCVFPLSFC